MTADIWIGRAARGLTIGAIVFVGLTAVLLAFPPVRGWLSREPTAYATGQHVDVPGSLYESAPATVLIFARNSCPACQKAKPVLSDLVARLNAASSSTGVRVVVVTVGTDAAGATGYAASLGLAEDRVAGLPPETLRLRLVPTVLLVDRQGTIRYAREGIPLARDVAGLLAEAARLTPEPQAIR